MADLYDNSAGSLNDPLNIQPGYQLSVVDVYGVPVRDDQFYGLPSSVSFRMPPQSLSIQRTIRSSVMKDISGAASVVTGGEGLGRITIQGTHGVGQIIDPISLKPGDDLNYPSRGRDIRDRIRSFFDVFTRVNDDRGRTGQAAFMMIFGIVGGRWSEPESESYYVWPDSFPVDARAAGRPHSWDWSFSMQIIGNVDEPQPPFDANEVLAPAAAIKRLTGMEALLAKLQKAWKRFKKGLQYLKDLRSSLLQIAKRIQDFVNGSKEAIYEVTDLVRGSAQLCSNILRSISITDFKIDAMAALRGAIYDCRRLIGQTKLTAAGFLKASTVPTSLTAPQTASLSRPVSIGLVAGDSLQAIAARFLGSSARWTQLVTVNQLVFPFVDFNGTNGRPSASYAGLRVFGAGDILRLPLPAAASVQGVSADPIGTDLQDEPTEANTLQGGISNLRAAVLRRLITPRGRIPWHPGYGSMLRRKLGTSLTLASVAAAEADVVSTTKQDPRVLDVRDVRVIVQNDAILISCNVLCPAGIFPVTSQL